MYHNRDSVPSIDETHRSDCFYSQNIIELFTKVFATDRNSSTNLHLPILHPHNLTFDYDRIEQLIGPLLSEKDVSYDVNASAEMKDYLESLVPVIDLVYWQFSDIIKADPTGERLISIIGPNIYWTGNWQKYFIDSIVIAIDIRSENLLSNELFNAEEKRIVRHILALHIVTSGLEQALGNLVLTQSHFVPPLLKTLLCMPELEGLIGYPLIRLLKIIVGPPITLNLRNIIWHGFVNCCNSIARPSSDCKKSIENVSVDFRRFFYFLLAIIASIGVHLQQSNVLKQLLMLNIDSLSDSVKSSNIVNAIPQRRLFDFDEFAPRLKTVFPCVNLSPIDFQYLKNLIHENSAIHYTLQPLWLAAFDLYFANCGENSQRYRNYSFCLLMPLLEAALRYLYCTVNEMPNRLLTAICSEYYVTFTEILAFDLLSQQNSYEVKSVESAVEFSPEKLSNRLYHFLPRPLMTLLLDFILLPEGLRFRDRLSHGQIELYSINTTISDAIFGMIITVLQNSIRSCAKIKIPDSILPILQYANNDHECIYHPIFQLKSQLKSLINCLRKFSDLTEKNNCDYKQNSLDSYLNRINRIQIELSCQFVERTCSLVLLLRNLVSNHERVINNFCSFIELRRDEATRSILRSRQRTNFQSFLRNLPSYLCWSCGEQTSIWFVMLPIFENLDRATVMWNDANTNRKQSLPKSLKRLLQIAENLAQLSTITENRWDKVAHLFREQSKPLADIFSMFA